MNLRQLSDETLLLKTETLVKKERELLTVVLYHLKEIERRRPFSDLKYSSMYEYAVKKLGYSEDQAYRRIAAARLLDQIPELETKINEGSLNLSHMGMAQSFFKKEEKLTNKTMTKSEKLEVLACLENKPIREAEKVMFTLSATPELNFSERVKVVGSHQLEITFTCDQALNDKISKLKGLMAHSHPDISLNELFHKLCDLGLDSLTNGRAPKKSKSLQTMKNEKNVTSHEDEKPPRDVDNAQGTNIHTPSTKISIPSATSRDAVRRISQAKIYREVSRRAGGKCENCQSTYALQRDHIQPKAFGGDSSLENLRLLCRSCNQRAAMKNLGLAKMEKYLERKH